MSAPPPLNPRDYLGYVIAWNTLNFVAGVGNLALFITSLCIPRLRKNILLLNVEFLFFCSHASTTALTWTGNALNPTPPFGPCLFNGAVAWSNAFAAGSSATFLVMKIWANTLSVMYPSAMILNWLSWEPFLFVAPYLLSVPVWIKAQVIGNKHHYLVLRVAPTYCAVLDNDLATITPYFGMIISGGGFLLAVWTALIVMRVRRRVKSMATRRAPIKNYTLVLRVLIFSIFMFVGLINNIVSSTGKHNPLVRDIIYTLSGIATIFIFGTDKDILALVFRCHRSTSLDTTGQGRSQTAVSYTKQTVVRRDGQASELVTFPPTTGSMYGNPGAHSKQSEAELETGSVVRDAYGELAIHDLRKEGAGDLDADEDWDAKNPPIGRAA